MPSYKYMYAKYVGMLIFELFVNRTQFVKIGENLLTDTPL